MLTLRALSHLFPATMKINKFCTEGGGLIGNEWLTCPFYANY